MNVYAKVMISANIDFQSLIIAAYKRSHKRILFLDYDGTLVSFARFPELAIIDKKTLGIIERLTSDSSNHVVIISGRDKNFLGRQFDGVNVTLVAEHGYFVRRNGDDWKVTDSSDTQWKSLVIPIFSEYVTSCNGTFIEEKAGCLAWHYRNADNDIAELRLNELRDDLTRLIRHKPDLEILEGNKVMEIKSRKFNKGTAAMSLMNKEHFDFVLAAGDDKTDEALFTILPEGSHSICVGSTPSIAKYNVSEISVLLKLLKNLMK